MIRSTRRRQRAAVAPTKIVFGRSKELNRRDVRAFRAFLVAFCGLRRALLLRTGRGQRFLATLIVVRGGAIEVLNSGREPPSADALFRDSVFSGVTKRSCLEPFLWQRASAL